MDSIKSRYPLGREGEQPYSSGESRRRQQERWIALQASEQTYTAPQLDPPPAPKQGPRPVGAPTSYINGINSRIDRAIAAQPKR